MKKEHILHGDIRPSDIAFQYTSVVPFQNEVNEQTGWIMYNHQ
jgi:hypothetical protein